MELRKTNQKPHNSSTIKRTRRKPIMGFRSFSVTENDIKQQGKINQTLMKRSDTIKINDMIKSEGAFSEKTRGMVRIAWTKQRSGSVIGIRNLIEKSDEEEEKIEEFGIEEIDEISEHSSHMSDIISSVSSSMNESRVITLEEKAGVDPKKSEKKNSKFLINLDGKFKFFWDNFQILLILYVAIFSIYKISFVKDGENPLWDLFDYLIDIFFFLDIILNFFTPYFDPHQCEYVNHHGKIALNYLKLEFWLDFLSVFPFDWFFSNGNSDYSILLRISKLPKVTKVFRTAKIIRAFKVGKKDTKLKRLVKWLSSSSYIFTKVIPLMFVTLNVGHIFACIWHYLAVSDDDPLTWLNRYEFQNESQLDRYTVSLYYSLTTMTTTGYGDIVPETSYEFALNFVIMFVGVILHSIVFGMIFDAIEKNRKEFDKDNEKKKFLKDLKKQKYFKEEEGEEIYHSILSEIHDRRILKNKVVKFPEFKNVKPKDVENLKIEVLKKKKKIRRNSFFKGFSLTKHWIKFYEKMERNVYKKGEIIFQEGDESHNFYILLKGKVKFLLRKETTNELKKYIENLHNDNHRHKSVYVKPAESKEIQDELQRKRMSMAPNKFLEKKIEKIEKVGKFEDFENFKDDDDVLRTFPFYQLDSFFGEFEMFEKKSENEEAYRKFTVVATSRCEIYRIKAKDFLQLIEESGEQAEFMYSLYNRYDRVLEAEKNVLEMLKKFASELKKAKKIKKNQVVPLSGSEQNVTPRRENGKIEMIEESGEIQKKGKNIKISKFEGVRKISEGKTKSRDSHSRKIIKVNDDDEFDSQSGKNSGEKKMRIKEYNNDNNQRDEWNFLSSWKNNKFIQKISGGKKNDSEELDFGFESKRSLKSE